MTEQIRNPLECGESRRGLFDRGCNHQRGKDAAVLKVLLRCAKNVHLRQNLADCPSDVDAD